MTLSNDDYRLLENILPTAFPGYEILEQMLMHQLGENLEAIAGGGSLQTVIFNLVHTWARPQGRIPHLVLGSLRENPGNSDLQLFCLFMLLDQAVFSLEEMHWFYHRAMPGHAVVKPLPPNADAHELLSQLAKMPSQSPENTLPLLTFATLMASHEKGRLIDHQLREWMDLIVLAYQLQPNAIADHQLDIANQPCNFLDVLVIPVDLAQTKFKIKILSERDPQTVVEIEDREYTELSDLASPILDALNILADNGFNTLHTTIEFFLPFRLLSEAVDQYQLPVPGQPLKLGFLHRVTVRSLDRSQNPHLLRFSREKWDRLVECQDLPDQQRLTRVAPFTDFSPLTSLSYELLTSEFVCLGLTLIPNSIQQSIDLISRIIAGGIPIALWIRRFQFTEDLLGSENMGVNTIMEHDINQLPDYIHQERRRATFCDDNDCGNHFTLLWDDPYRTPRLSSLRAG